MGRIGILAYGSLINDPREEIDNVTAERIKDVKTPFKVEFARRSCTRGGAPTLVPVKEGGACVKAVILVLQKHISEQETKNMLWRRETNRVGSGEPYNPSANPAVCMEMIEQFHGIEVVLYTSIKPNIKRLTPQRLAELAIESARGHAGSERRDGISYLIDAKSNGINTPFMNEYEGEILRQTGTESLEEALAKLQSSPS